MQALLPTYTSRRAFRIYTYLMCDKAEFLYKTTDYYAPMHERCIRWDDPEIAVKWPLAGTFSLSEKDSKGASLSQAEAFS